MFACVEQADNDRDAAIGEKAYRAKTETNKSTGLINPNGKTIDKRFMVPVGFVRPKYEQNSYQQYLRTLPLKPHGTEVMYYNGQFKTNQKIYDAVVDLPIGTKNLHQCADAIMRLRAEHLWRSGQFEKIHFNFTNGMQVDYSEWIKGKRIQVNGNESIWIPKSVPSNTYSDFWKYMETIFMYAGTLSLEKELKPIDVQNLEIGDVFIQGGSPGHAVIVVDISINKSTRDKLFLLAQSYMPAQEVQILKNPNNAQISPWYSGHFREVLETPEWNFKSSDLRRFE